MLNFFEKKLRDSEIKWDFILIPKKYRPLFPISEVFEMNYKGKTFRVSLNKAKRIVSKELFQEFKPHVGSVLVVTKNSPNEFAISVKVGEF